MIVSGDSEKYSAKPVFRVYLQFSWRADRGGRPLSRLRDFTIARHWRGSHGHVINQHDHKCLATKARSSLAALRDRSSPMMHQCLFGCAIFCWMTLSVEAWVSLGRDFKFVALHLANLVQGTVCKILDRYEVKPHKVRYYLERRDAEFEQKMAQVLCVYREVEVLKKACRVGEAEQGSGDRLLRREARHPSDRDDGAGLAARARRACELRARL